MKALRWVGLGVAAVLVLLAAAVAILYALFDGDKVKAELSRAMLQDKQRTLVIAGKPQLSVWPDVGIALDGVSLTERNSTAQFMKLDSARVSVALMPLLSKRVEVRALELNGLQATVVKKKDGTLSISDLLGDTQHDHAYDPAKPDANTPRSPLQVDVASIRMSNAQFTWRDEKAGTSTAVSNLSLSTGRVQADTGQKTAQVQSLLLSVKGESNKEAFDLALDVPRLVVAADKSSGEAVKLRASLNGVGRKADVLLTLSGVEGNAQGFKVGSLNLGLDALSGEATVKGQLSSPVAVNMTAQTVSLPTLTGSLDIAHPAMPMKQLRLPLSGSLSANLAQQTANLALNTQVDASKVQSKVNVTQFSPLALAFDLGVDQLNIDTYLPPKPAAAGGASGGASGGAASAAASEPLDLSALKGPRVGGVLRVGALQVSGLKLSQLNATLKLSGGRLDVAPLSMNLYEGTANGALSVNAAGNAVSLKQTLAGVRINPLMQDLLHKDLLEGRGNVVLDVQTQGPHVLAMKKALSGSAALSLKDGAVKGINLAQSLRDLKSKLGQADSTQQAKAGEKTDFSELSASFKIASGVAHNEDLAMKSPFIRLSGAGDIDVGLGQMNYLAKATVVGSAEGQGGKDVSQLKGLTVPVRVSGPFEQLSYKLEFGSMVSDLAKAKVEEKKEEIKTQIKNQVEDKAKDLLKGILGR
ncbi:AsmA family protein [Rhodoferax aquaticus]|uniref:AsmA family protein n=1 Tax=Rhodoferax aquaticus TaxID=2527691 RepID=A0A515EUG5_9BURK|nr:AsmA family protein [Rhodoferax aquaticus]QDL56320.1 AsmA family protein [Rhodoferax aquaticus]